MTSDLARQAGALFAELRGATSKTEMARDLKISRPQLHRLEAGEWNITLGRLEELAQVYGVTLHIGVLGGQRTVDRVAG